MLRFNDIEEFFEELKKDRDLIERGIVRVTSILRPSQSVPSIFHIVVAATARVAGEIVRLDIYCGDVFQGFDRDSEVLKAANEKIGMIKERCTSLELDVRAGVLSDD
jgi:dsDNA-specific endonuclease/ATPase MutS2